MRRIELNLNFNTIVTDIIENIKMMSLTSFKNYAKSNLNDPIPINQDIHNAIIERMKLENLTMEDL